MGDTKVNAARGTAGVAPVQNDQVLISQIASYFEGEKRALEIASIKLDAADLRALGACINNTRSRPNTLGQRAACKVLSLGLELHEFMALLRANWDPNRIPNLNETMLRRQVQASRAEGGESAVLIRTGAFDGVVTGEEEKHIWARANTLVALRGPSIPACQAPTRPSGSSLGSSLVTQAKLLADEAKKDAAQSGDKAASPARSPGSVADWSARRLKRFKAEGWLGTTSEGVLRPEIDARAITKDLLHLAMLDPCIAIDTWGTIAALARDEATRRVVLEIAVDLVAGLTREQLTAVRFGPHSEDLVTVVARWLGEVPLEDRHLRALFTAALLTGQTQGIDAIIDAQKRAHKGKGVKEQRAAGLATGIALAAAAEKHGGLSRSYYLLDDQNRDDFRVGLTKGLSRNPRVKILPG